MDLDNSVECSMATVFLPTGIQVVICVGKDDPTSVNSILNPKGTQYVDKLILHGPGASPALHAVVNDELEAIYCNLPMIVTIKNTE